jgi:hypothetical protein
MELEIIFFLPTVTSSGVQDVFPRQPRIPQAAGQRSGRASINTAGATAAEAALHWRPTGEVHIGKDRSQANPGAKLTGDKLAMAADPAQSCPGGRSFMGKVSFDVYRIAAFCSSQRLGSKAPASDGGCQNPRQLINLTVHPVILIRIGLGWAMADLGHDLGGYGNSPGKGAGKPSPFRILGGREPMQISRPPMDNCLLLHPQGQPRRERG